jgi:hypothetical protein
MNDPQSVPELPTPDEIFADADTSTIISDLVEEVRNEADNPLDDDVIRDQQNWASVANQFVGAENLGQVHND